MAEIVVCVQWLMVGYVPRPTQPAAAVHKLHKLCQHDALGPVSPLASLASPPSLAVNAPHHLGATLHPTTTLIVLLLLPHTYPPTRPPMHTHPHPPYTGCGAVPLH